MNLQPLIDNLPMILASLALLLWALSRVLEAYAKKNPVLDEWDRRAEILHRVSAQYAQALEWLVQAGAQKWSGAEKLAELNKRVREFEADWTAGNYLEALSKATGFYQAAMSKLEKAQGTTLPFAPRPSTVISPKASGLSPEQGEIGPDSPAVEN